MFQNAVEADTKKRRWRQKRNAGKMRVRYLIWITNKTSPHCLSPLFTDQCVCPTNGWWQFFSQLRRRIRKILGQRNSFLIVCRKHPSKVFAERCSLLHSHDSLRLGGRNLWFAFLLKVFWRLFHLMCRSRVFRISSLKETSPLALESCSTKLRNNKVARFHSMEMMEGEVFLFKGERTNEGEKKFGENNPSKH